MENSKKIVSPSSPFSGNNENESENQRNSEKNNNKQHYFMSPKFTTPKKKILKPPSKSSPHKMGTSNSSSKKYFTKNPSFSLSPNSNLEQFHDHNVNEDHEDDDTFVADSCSLPYDPLTNYLSPRPKFLRYNPNRKRKILVLREDKSDNCVVSPENSLDSVSSCTPKESISLKNEENEENKDDIEDDYDDEEMIEEEKWGLKWVLFKGLIVFFVLVFSTMYISSMNNLEFHPESRRVPLYEYEDFGNISFVSLSSRNLELKKGLSEINQLGVDSVIGVLVEAPEIEVGEESVGSSDCVLEENRVAISPQVSDGMIGGLFEAPEIEVGDESMGCCDCVLEETEVTNSPQDFQYEIDYQEMVRASYDFNSEGDFTDPMVGNFNDVEAENVAQIDVVDPNLVTEGESLGEIGDKKDDFELKFEVGKVANGVESVEEVSFDGVEEETQEEDKVLDFESKPMDGKPVHVVEIIDDGSFNGVEQEVNKGNYECEMVDYEPKSMDVQSENGSEIDGGNERSIVENFAWVVLLTVIGFVACLVAKFYNRCKKKSSKTTTTTSKKLNSEGEEVEINRLTEVPPKFGESFEPIHPKIDTQLNPPASTVVTEAREERVKTPSRIIPKVTQLGELDFGREFSSIKSAATRSGKVEEREANVCVVPDERRTKRSKVSSSYSSNISEEKTAKQEQIKEETTAIRRSTRLRSRGVTSP